MGMANIPRDSTAGTDSVLSIPMSTIATGTIELPAAPWMRRAKKAKGERDRRLSLVDPRLRRRALR